MKGLGDDHPSRRVLIRWCSFVTLAHCDLIAEIENGLLVDIESLEQSRDGPVRKNRNGLGPTRP